MTRVRLFACVASLALVACSADLSAPEGESGGRVTLSTQGRTARLQYDANVAFAQSYRSRCDAAAPGLRVLVTGYGRFQGNLDNATGRIVEALTGAAYPSTARPAAGMVDVPAPQTSVRTKAVVQPGLGPVSICGMILPVYWDLAPILLAREIEAFKPDFVVMNGVATGQLNIPLRVELGSTNIATAGPADGSGVLHAFATNPQGEAKVLSEGPDTIPSLLSWRRVQYALNSGVRSRPVLARGVSGVDFGGYPSTWLTYLCNNIVYTTNYLMDHPGMSTRMLEPSVRLGASDVGVQMTLRGDFRKTPRVFIHWPDLPRESHAAAADTLLEGITAQLLAQKAGEAPTRGDTMTPDQAPDR
jgi:pyrrolidone-carboxylate peptidase